MSIVITYETLFDILRKESSREDLQELPETFYVDVNAFLEEKKSDSGANQRAAIEYENSQKIIRELYDRRERKLLLLALNKARTESAIIDPSILLPEEHNLFDDIVLKLRTNKQSVLSGVTVAPREKPVRMAKEKAEAAKTGAVVDETASRLQTKNTASERPETGESTTAKSAGSDVRVTFVKPVPKFVGRDMTIFGPFNPGDTTELPEEVAAVLAKKGHITLSTSS